MNPETVKNFNLMVRGVVSSFERLEKAWELGWRNDRIRKRV